MQQNAHHFAQNQQQYGYGYNNVNPPDSIGYGNGDGLRSRNSSDSSRGPLAHSPSLLSTTPPTANSTHSHTQSNQHSHSYSQSHSNQHSNTSSATQSFLLGPGALESLNQSPFEMDGLQALEGSNSILPGERSSSVSRSNSTNNLQFQNPNIQNSSASTFAIKMEGMESSSRLQFFDSVNAMTGGIQNSSSPFSNTPNIPPSSTNSASSSMAPDLSAELQDFRMFAERHAPREK